MATALACALALSALLPVTGCSRDGATTVDITGRVVDETVALPAPVIAVPAPDIEAGFDTSAPTTASAGANDAPASGAAGAGAQGAGSSAGGWVRVGALSANVGDTVSTGQVLATMDTAALGAALEAAKADEKLAQANVKLVDDRAGTLTLTASEIASKTVELNKTITDLTLQRAELQIKLNAAKAAAGSLTPTSTIPPGQTDPRVLVKQLEAALAKVDAALEKARQGVTDLATAQTDVNTAQSTVRYVRDAASAIAEGYAAAADLARAQYDRAQITAPFDAEVVSIAQPGAVLAGGAPVVVLRRSSAGRIETFVTDETRPALAVGAQVAVFSDSQPSRGYTGRISAIGNEYGFVPTYFATKVIHLTRGFRVEIELDQGQTLPAGTPVDVSISVN